MLAIASLLSFFAAAFFCDECGAPPLDRSIASLGRKGLWRWRRRRHRLCTTINIARGPQQRAGIIQKALFYIGSPPYFDVVISRLTIVECNSNAQHIAVFRGKRHSSDQIALALAVTTLLAAPPYSGFGFERIALSPRCRSNGCQQDRHRRPQEHSHFTWSSSGRIVWPHCLRRTGSHFAGK
ncbi:MAG: hypothetical protein U1E81_23980 [Xanthobacteraceae bacterium]